MPLICFSVASIAKTHRLLQAVRLQLEGNRNTDVRETVGKFTPECTLNKVHGAQSGGVVRGGTLAENRPTQLRWWRRRCDLLPFPKMFRCCGDCQQCVAVSVVRRAWCILTGTCSRTAQFLPVAPLSFDCFFGNTFHLASYVSLATASFVHPLKKNSPLLDVAECSHDERTSRRYHVFTCSHLSGYNPCYTTQLIALAMFGVSSSPNSSTTIFSMFFRFSLRSHAGFSHLEKLPPPVLSTSFWPDLSTTTLLEYLLPLSCRITPPVACPIRRPPVSLSWSVKLSATDFKFLRSIALLLIFLAVSCFHEIGSGRVSAPEDFKKKIAEHTMPVACGVCERGTRSFSPRHLVY